jgi:hypothetical protein
MSAYTWEFIAQVVAMKLIQYYDNTLPGYSDCQATIARMNTALSSFINPLAHTTAGILSCAAHMHSSPHLPRRIQHIKAHPERDLARMQNPSSLDKGIFLADAIAGNTTTKFNSDHLNHIPHALVLEDILTEILPLNIWHLRETNNLTFPMLDLPWQHQHLAQWQMYLNKRDAYSSHSSDHWSRTALDFTDSVHPINSKHSKSYWHSARRTLVLFDWLGHGYNQTKRAPINPSQAPLLPTPPVGMCPLCAQPDVQEHVMVACTNPLLTPIRAKAKQTQSQVAQKLKQLHKLPIEHYFIDQLIHASWVHPSLHTRRIWLGTWDVPTLISLFPPAHDLHSYMNPDGRHKFRAIARQLLAPLIHAYNRMIRIPHHIHCTPPTHSHAQQRRAKHCIASLFPQNAPLPHNYSLTTISHHTQHNLFTYSDSAFSLTDAEVGMI